MFPKKIQLKNSWLLIHCAWWRHQIETFSALLAICAGNSPVPGEFPSQWPVTWSFDVYFDLRPNKRLNKQWWGWWFETPSCPLWHLSNGTSTQSLQILLMILSWIYTSHGEAFPHYWPFVRGIHQSPVDTPHKWTNNAKLWCSLNQLLNKELSCWCLEMSWFSCNHCSGGLTVMPFCQAIIWTNDGILLIVYP